jgi:ATP-dependent RNA helicase RhlE
LTTSTFAALGLNESLLRALAGTDYKTPTPIQTKAIPPLLQGKDLLGIAQTGTGKTAAFALPLLHRLAQDRRPPLPRTTRALILAPTRELATQIADNIKLYGRHTGLKHAVIMGGVSQRAQYKATERGVDILIATPGRLIDLIDQRRIDIRRTSYLVLDEADRMLDMGFIRDVRKLTALLPEGRQTALFSATMPKEIARLAAEILRDPVRVEIAAKTVAVDRIDQRVHHADSGAKRKLLTDLLADASLSRVIVFTRTKRGADRVAKQLTANGVRTAALHGDKSQSSREQALNSFRAGRSRVLVATDIASRGIDVDDVTHVINYELPKDPESYIHRIGRTARAGASGIAISFCDPSERKELQSIERLIKRQLTVVGEGPKPERQGNAKPDHRNGAAPRFGGRQRPANANAAKSGRPRRRNRRRAA